MFNTSSRYSLIVWGVAALLASGSAGAQSPPAPAAAAASPPGSPAVPAPAKPVAVPMVTPPEGVPALVPLGPPPGRAAETLPEDMQNPLHGQPSAVTEGKQLFVQMNCAGCHGYGATGGMGPNLTNGSWRFGGTPVDIFKSIFEGRPEGMPAWGAALPAQEIWKIVAYIQSLGGTVPPGRYYQSMAGDHEGELTAPQLEPGHAPAGAARPGSSAPPAARPPKP